MEAADVEIHQAGANRFLLIERYDRQTNAQGQTRRVHQDDFCQAMGYTSAQKYAADGGPTFRDCFALLRRAATRPAGDILKLLDAALFNLIIGNADAHGKNYSLLYRGDSIMLAPLYDLLSTVYYPDLAMKIAKRAKLEDLQKRDWATFAEKTGLTEPYIRRRTAALAGKVVDQAEAARTSFQPPEDDVMKTFSDFVSGRASTLLDVV